MTTPPSRPHPTDNLAAGQRQVSPQTQQMIDEVEGVYSTPDPVVDANVDQSMRRAKEEGVSPLAVIGSTPAVDQPGRPSMSQKGVDDSVRMLCASVLAVAVGGAVSGALYFSGKADPVVVGLIAATPPATFLSIRSVVKSAKRLIPDQHTHRYEGPVIQDNRQDHSTQEIKTKGIWTKVTNNPKGKP